MTLVQALVDTAQDRPVLAFAVVSLLLIAAVTASTARQEYPNLPWIGRDDTKSFATTRAAFSSISNVKNWLAEGYQKVSIPRSPSDLAEPGLTDRLLNSTHRKANHTSSRTSLDAMKL